MCSIYSTLNHKTIHSQLTKESNVDKHLDNSALTILPLAPDVVIREIQFFPEGFNIPSDSRSFNIPELVLELRLLVIFLSKYVKAASPLLRIFFSIFNCNVIGSEMKNILKHYNFTQKISNGSKERPCTALKDNCQSFIKSVRAQVFLQFSTIA